METKLIIFLFKYLNCLYLVYNIHNLSLFLSLLVILCSDPETKAWLAHHKHSVFGFPTLVRFSWGTCTPYFRDIVEVLW